MRSVTSGASAGRRISEIVDDLLLQASLSKIAYYLLRGLLKNRSQRLHRKHIVLIGANNVDLHSRRQAPATALDQLDRVWALLDAKSSRQTEMLPLTEGGLKSKFRPL